MAEGTGISMTMQLCWSLSGFVSAALGQVCGCSCVDAQGRGKACARNSPCRFRCSLERSSSGRELLRSAWSCCGRDPWAGMVAGVLQVFLGTLALCSVQPAASAAWILLHLRHHSSSLVYSLPTEGSFFRWREQHEKGWLASSPYSNAVWVGIATLLGMQQPSSYGLMGCFQESPVLETSGQAGHRQHKCSPHAKPGSVCCVREQGGRVLCSLPCCLLPPLHSPIYIPVNLFER